MKRKSFLIFVCVLVVAFTCSLSGCRRKEAETVTAETPETPTEPLVSLEAVPEETMSESVPERETAAETSSESLKAEAEEYAAYIQMQEDKIGILMRQGASCETYKDYEALMDRIISIAEDVKSYPVPEDNEELKEMTADAMDEILKTVKDSKSRAKGILKYQ